MEEDITDYIKSVKNNPEERDEASRGYIGQIKAIHDETFDNGVNSFNVDINTLLLSYFERLSYFDEAHSSYESYARYASFLNLHPKRETDYDVNAKADKESGHKGAKGSLALLVQVANQIQEPSFRVYLMLLTVSLFKDIGPVSKKQRDFLSMALENLQI